MSENLDDFLGGLKPDEVIENVGPKRALSISEALAIRGWFDARRKKIISTGGRPTNPDWSVKRQIPMTEETWELLKVYAAELSTEGSALSPAQLASLLLDTAIEQKVRPEVTDTPEDDILEDDSLSPRFRDWQLHELFGARVAA